MNEKKARDLCEFLTDVSSDELAACLVMAPGVVVSVTPTAVTIRRGDDLFVMSVDDVEEITRNRKGVTIKTKSGSIKIGMGVP